MLVQTLEMLRRVDGEMSVMRTEMVQMRIHFDQEMGQMRTHFDRGMGQMRAQLLQLERVQCSPHIDHSSVHIDDGDEQHLGGDQIYPSHHDGDDEACTSVLQEDDVVRVDKRPMRDRKKSQFCKTPFTDPIRSKKRNVDVAVEGSDAVPQVGDDDLNPPEGYTEFIASKENIFRDTGYLEYLSPADFRCIDDMSEWLDGRHIDSYMCCLRRIQSRPLYNDNYAIMSTPLFSYISTFWTQEYDGDNGKVFDPSTAIVPTEWTCFVDGSNEGNLPWWTVDNVLLPCNYKNQHWFLIKISLKNKILFLYDSSAKSEDSRRIRVAAVTPLAKLLPIILKSSGYYKHVSATTTSDREWDVEGTDPHKVPQQVDSASCGCFVIKYIEDILRHNEGSWQIDPNPDVYTLRRQIGIFLYRHSKFVVD
ncbi:uncharacterized protein LOC127787690 [Diospyros lotus]|uniref:uncharacterized protein LOC127787690 n=1 Tax=Diospyros lotus TaxID=55363 RepID=UPI00224CFAB6|nr:uncharacterized protein LOC127787690 [Diospyros lotus]XP_052171723.1 uncharacterized protein LOC127787690 [Diospyros lotus]